MFATAIWATPKRWLAFMSRVAMWIRFATPKSCRVFTGGIGSGFWRPVSEWKNEMLCRDSRLMHELSGYPGVQGEWLRCSSSRHPIPATFASRSACGGTTSGGNTSWVARRSSAGPKIGGYEDHRTEGGGVRVTMRSANVGNAMLHAIYE